MECILEMYLTCCCRLTEHYTDRCTYSHDIALVDQGGTRPTFLCVLNVYGIIACGKMTEHQHTYTYIHDIALVDQGGFRPTFRCVLIFVECREITEH